MSPRRLLLPLLTGAALAAAALSAQAQDTAAIRKALAERLQMPQQVDEITRTPIPGLYEVRVGTDVLYSDAKGDFLIQGELLDTKGKRNLTSERINKLTAIDFAALPAQDAFTIVRGNGKRQVAVFEDPNCGYCRRFENDLKTIDNVTVHVYLYPILGPDSIAKSKNLWCAKDKGRAWQEWMLESKAIPPASCDTAALDRNVAFGRKHKINGTPTLIFADGSRVPGAISAADIEKQLNVATR
ncbi:thioredoxin fold domain-containing protein [Xylophilus rhododendri]|uniref:Thiol:disulfide interchange protein n=1 Tax=Xylophilus rhododendri TaxID=2697032 RepID=A0A857J628_9BURK|nr:DsbC family protein [Xylophilus rhododendri]QHI98451.1 thioredoxin fold domain-containing protein [Xylophilus rhododendri]